MPVAVAWIGDLERLRRAVAKCGMWQESSCLESSCFRTLANFRVTIFSLSFAEGDIEEIPICTLVLFGLTVVILGGAVRAAAARMDSSAPVQISILDSLLSFGFSSMCKLIYFVYLIQFVLCEVNL